MIAQLHELHADPESWNSTIFYSSCYASLKELEKFADPVSRPLLQLPSVKKFKLAITKAMSTQLTSYWKKYPKASTTRNLHDKWIRQPLSPLHASRRSEVCYYRLGFAQNDLYSFQSKIKPSTNSLCRACKTSNETTEHVLMQCADYNRQREKLKRAAENNRLHFSCKSLLTEPVLKVHTEQFLLHTILKQQS